MAELPEQRETPPSPALPVSDALPGAGMDCIGTLQLVPTGILDNVEGLLNCPVCECRLGMYYATMQRMFLICESYYCDFSFGYEPIQIDTDQSQLVDNPHPATADFWEYLATCSPSNKKDGASSNAEQEKLFQPGTSHGSDAEESSVAEQGFVSEELSKPDTSHGSGAEESSVAEQRVVSEELSKPDTSHGSGAEESSVAEQRVVSEELSKPGTSHGSGAEKSSVVEQGELSKPRTSHGSGAEESSVAEQRFVSEELSKPGTSHGSGAEKSSVVEQGFVSEELSKPGTSHGSGAEESSVAEQRFVSEELSKPGTSHGSGAEERSVAEQRFVSEELSKPGTSHGSGAEESSVAEQGFLSEKLSKPGTSHKSGVEKSSVAEQGLEQKRNIEEDFLNQLKECLNFTDTLCGMLKKKRHIPRKKIIDKKWLFKLARDGKYEQKERKLTKKEKIEISKGEKPRNTAKDTRSTEVSLESEKFLNKLLDLLTDH